MWIFIKLAWRNVLRNKRRSLLAGIAIAIGLAGLIFTDALMIGMMENMVYSATASYLGEAQIHREGYRDTHEVNLTIQQYDSVVSQLQQESIVERWTPRTYAFSMVSSAANAGSVVLVGIDPNAEKAISQIDDAMVEGNYVGASGERDIVIGRSLAELLEVEVGGRVVVTVAQAETGDLSQEMFRVAGIYSFGIREMDRGMAFVSLARSQQMLGIGTKVHEIVIKFTDTEYGRTSDLPFWEHYSQYGNEAVGWTTLLPQLESAFKLSEFSMFIIGVILFGIVVFGIINTLFMSLYERMFEFGVLRAVGTRPMRLALLILLEAAALAVLSVLLGVLLGFIVTLITMKTGIDYRGVEYAGVTVREMIYPVMNWQQFVKYPIWVFLFTLIAGIYPAWHAARISPAKAMRRSF